MATIYFMVSLDIDDHGDQKSRDAFIKAMEGKGFVKEAPSTTWTGRLEYETQRPGTLIVMNSIKAKVKECAKSSNTPLTALCVMFSDYQPVRL